MALSATTGAIGSAITRAATRTASGFPPAPTLTDEVVIAAELRRKRQLAAMAGRASTFLSGPRGLGGPSSELAETFLRARAEAPTYATTFGGTGPGGAAAAQAGGIIGSVAGGSGSGLPGLQGLLPSLPGAGGLLDGLAGILGDALTKGSPSASPGALAGAVEALLPATSPSPSPSPIAKRRTRQPFRALGGVL